MQTKKIYSKRRRNQRRDSAFEISLPDQDKRHGARRCNPRRRNVRLNYSFEVSLPDQDSKTNSKTINISASGVYFEVITNDMEAFSTGTTIPLQMCINTVTKILVRGKVIRNCIIENPDHDNTLGVALEFTEELNIVYE